MTWVVLVSSAALAAVAAAGVLRPFRGGAVVLDRLDPLDDERHGLLRALRDLDDERASGQLSEEDYRTLRAETEARAVAVLRALEARDRAGEWASDLRALRAPAQGNGGKAGSSPGRPDRDHRRVLVGVLAGALFIAVVVPVLAHAVGARAPAQPITGEAVGGNPLAFFERRVRLHPNDVAARLDLAQRYLEAGDAKSAVAQYLAVLNLDPRNAEAEANLGFVLYEAGRAEDGLRAVEGALASDPGYPEALYFKGVILLRGLNRPQDAAASFRAYLDAAPFGSHRTEVQTLLGEAQR